DRRRTCTGRADLVLEIARDLAQLRAAQRLGPNLERRILAVSRAAASLHDRVRIAVVRHHPLDVAGSLRRRRLELELRSALEVDAEVEPADRQCADAERDDRARDREPEVAAAHEVDL